MVVLTTHPSPMRAAPDTARPRRRPDLGRKIVGGFYLTMGGVHLGIAAADPQTYGPFADGALLPFIRTAWAEIFMATPALWGMALCLGEVVIGVMLQVGGRWTKPGWALVVAFHLGLLLVAGWGILLWVVPAMAVVVPLALRDWRRAPSS